MGCKKSGWKVIGWMACLLSLAACTDSAQPPGAPPHNIVAETITGCVKDAVGALLMPLEDLNIKRQPIPEKLQALIADPYALPKPLNCETIKCEIADLNDALGSDVASPLDQEGHYVDKGAALAREQAAGFVRSQTDVIPFRGVLRRISGADKHARKVAQAYAAGRTRRDFLRGLAAGYHCKMK